MKPILEITEEARTLESEIVYSIGQRNVLKYLSRGRIHALQLTLFSVSSQADLWAEPDYLWFFGRNSWENAVAAAVILEWSVPELSGENFGAKMTL